MSGKKSDTGWGLDPVQQLVKDRFLSEAKELGNPVHAVLLALTSNLIYEMAYKLTWWQWLFFPLLSLRLYRLQVSIRKHAPPRCSATKDAGANSLAAGVREKSPTDSRHFFGPSEHRAESAPALAHPASFQLTSAAPSRRPASG